MNSIENGMRVHEFREKVLQKVFCQSSSKAMHIDEREREISISCLLYMTRPGIEPATQVCALTINLTYSLFGVWDNAPTTSATQPGQ